MSLFTSEGKRQKGFSGATPEIGKVCDLKGLEERVQQTFEEHLRDVVHGRV